MESMLNTIWLIITALAFGGVVEKAGVIERLITPVIRAAKSTGSLVASLVGAVLATNIVTADQYIAIVLPGRMFKSAFENRGFAPVVLSAHHRRLWNADRRAGPLEQLRRLPRRHLGCPHLDLFALRGLQLREPAAGHHLRVCRPQDDARPGNAAASVGAKGTDNGDRGVASVGSVVGGRRGASRISALASRDRITARLR